MNICLTRRYGFSASHRLHSSEMSEQANQTIYGKCNYPFGHGHNYEVEVTVRGDVDPISGRVVDLRQLDKLVRATVIEPFAHRNLNEEVPEFLQLVPTTENLAVIMDRRLRAEWQNSFSTLQPALERVRIYETARNIFEI